MKDRIKLILSDIDGTLLINHHQLGPKTIEIVKKVKEKIPIVLVSGRMPNAISFLHHELDLGQNPLIAYNGGMVLDGDITLYETSFFGNLVLQVLESVSDENVAPAIFSGQHWHIKSDSPIVQREVEITQVFPILESPFAVAERLIDRALPIHKLMIFGTESVMDSVFLKLSFRFQNKINLYRAGAGIIELTPIQTNKAKAVEHLLKKLNISWEEVLAFGDNYNDLEMIISAGYGIVMANGKEELKPHAWRIAPSNHDEGVATILEDIFL